MMASLYSTSQTLYSLFEDSSKTQDSFIVFHDGLKDTKISYKDVTSSIGVVCNMLADVSSQEVVGCLCRPHLLQPVLMLGILKSSSAFTFLDVRSPLVFLENLEKHVLIRTLLAEEKTLESLKSPLCSCWKTIKNLAVLGTEVKVLRFSQNNCSSTKCTKNLRETIETFHFHDELAYVIKTSGTTGEPKVVQVPHQCIVPNIIHLRSIYSVSSKDVILLCAPLTFDPSIVEIFLALSSSATLIIASDSVKSVPRNLAKVINKCGVTIMQATPSLLHMCGTDLIRNEILTKNTSLRILSFGGERCPSFNKLCSWKSDGNTTQFFNLYGITEVSCWATVEKINLEQKHNNVEIHLGKPLLNTDIEVRNENDEVINDGFGQLFIGGSKRWCVLNNEPWPLYRSILMRPTGDWVLKMSDGSLRFEGRCDSLVKYHGRKFSLYSLNEVIESKSEINSHSLYFNKETEKLYAFLVLNESSYNREETIRHSVLQALQSTETNIPPVVIIIVPFIPITVHGKADNKRLLRYAENRFSKMNMLDNKMSSDSLEKYLRTLWKDCTGNNAIKNSDNFILDGGDSVSSIQFVLEMEWKFQISLPGLVDVLLNSTFENVCKYVQEYLYRTSYNNPNFKKFKKDEGAPSSTIATNSNLAAVQSANKPVSSLYNLSYSSSVSPIGSCHKVFSRQEKKVMCFCGKCFSSEFESEQESFKCELSLQEEFKYDLKKCIDASPCCCDFVGRYVLAFIGSHSGYFVALDIKKGLIVWKQMLPDRIESSACLSSCGGYVLVGCYDYHLYCFIVQSGEIMWKYRTNAEVKSSPIVSPKGIAYIGSHDHHLHAVCLTNGKLLWKTKVSNGSIFSSPILCADNSFVCAATLDGVIGALDSDTGQILWTYSHTSPLFSSPLNVKSNILIGGVDGSMLCFSEIGKLVGKYLTPGPIFSSASYVEFSDKNCQNKDCIVFGSHSCMVYCYTIKGIFQWKFLCSSAVYATPFSFCRNGQSYIAVASTKGTVYILNAHDGNLLYSVNCSGEIFSSPVVINDYLVIGCRDNNFYCFKIKSEIT